MENIHTILSKYGITVPEDKRAEFDKAVADNYKTVVEHERKVTRLSDDLKEASERADTAEQTLKGFEGKDFDAITKERDEWKRKHDENQQKYQQEQEEREFKEMLTAAISEAKGKNEKAIIANLDLEALRKSRNQKSDVKTALDSLRTEHGFLFDDNGGHPVFSASNSNNSAHGGTLTKKDIVAIRDPAERQRQIGLNFGLFKKGE